MVVFVLANLNTVLKIKGVCQRQFIGVFATEAGPELQTQAINSKFLFYLEDSGLQS